MENFNIFYKEKFVKNNIFRFDKVERSHYFHVKFPGNFFCFWKVRKTSFFSKRGTNWYLN